MPVVANFWENEASEARSKRSVSRELRNKAHKTCCVRYLMRFLGTGAAAGHFRQRFVFSCVFLFLLFLFSHDSFVSLNWRADEWENVKKREEVRERNHHNNYTLTHQIYTHSRYPHLSNHQQTFCNFSDMFWDLQIFLKGFMREGPTSPVSRYYANLRIQIDLQAWAVHSQTVQPTFQSLTIKTSNKSDLSISFC